MARLKTEKPKLIHIKKGSKIKRYLVYDGKRYEIDSPYDDKYLLSKLTKIIEKLIQYNARKKRRKVYKKAVASTGDITTRVTNNPYGNADKITPAQLVTALASTKNSDVKLLTNTPSNNTQPIHSKLLADSEKKLEDIQQKLIEYNVEAADKKHEITRRDQHISKLKETQGKLAERVNLNETKLIEDNEKIEQLKEENEKLVNEIEQNEKDLEYKRVLNYLYAIHYNDLENYFKSKGVKDLKVLRGTKDINKERIINQFLAMPGIYDKVKLDSIDFVQKDKKKIRFYSTPTKETPTKETPIKKTPTKEEPAKETPRKEEAKKVPADESFQTPTKNTPIIPSSNTGSKKSQRKSDKKKAIDEQYNDPVIPQPDFEEENVPVQKINPNIPSTKEQIDEVRVWLFGPGNGSLWDIAKKFNIPFRDKSGRNRSDKVIISQILREKPDETYALMKSKSSPVVVEELKDNIKKVNEEAKEFIEAKEKADKEGEELQEVLQETIEEIKGNNEQEGAGIKDMGLTNFEIEKFMKGYDKDGFIGVYAIDQLKNIKNPGHDFSLIMNTQPITVPIGHWIAVKVDKDTIEYYDSFAGDPPLELIRWLRKKLPANVYQLKVNRTKFQKANTSNCGYFAMDFLAKRYSGETFKEATGFKIFEDSINGEKEIKQLKKSIQEFGSLKIK